VHTPEIPFPWLFSGYARVILARSARTKRAITLLCQSTKPAMSAPANPAQTDHILTERIGKCLVITINRPAKLNGFTPEMAAQLARAYTGLEDDPGLWVAVVCAAGPHFTAGLDLPQWAGAMQEGRRMWPSDCIDPFDLSREPGTRRRTKPVILAVQGICYTLGIELMLAADMVVAADNCRFSQLEVKRGIMATGGATLRMAERAGIGNAMWCLLVGDEFDAATALRFNFVQKVVPVGQERAQALEWAEKVMAVAPLAARATRANVLLASEHGPNAAIAQFRDTQMQLARSDDAREGVQSFVEKRAARFVGR
jgi:enoyl-CoA hydratase